MFNSFETTILGGFIVKNSGNVYQFEECWVAARKVAPHFGKEAA
jgi:hypothetical protein